jgi:hypothetical protein
MLTLPFFGDHRFDSTSEPDLITDGAGAYEVEKEIRTRHG